MIDLETARGPLAVARFLRPQSVAIVGVSSRPGSAGQIILQSLKINDFAGEIYLVGRSSEPIDGKPVLKSPDELPEGVDLAVFTLPAAGVREAIEACARRKVGSALVFAAGFAEVGHQSTQDAVTEIARAAGLALVGPNCLGITNNVDGIMLHMLFARKALRDVRNGVAFVGQSGGLLGHFQRAAEGRGIPLSYIISTGNEAGLETTDFLDFLVDDPSTRVISLYCEQIARPRQFLAACHRARDAGKPVVLMQAGRSAKSRKNAQSHTGALIGDWLTVKTLAEDAGAIVVTSMDEMTDLVEILHRFPEPPTNGLGVLTASGAFVGLVNDFAEEVGMDIPDLDPATLAKASENLPAYGNYGNPLDVTAGNAPAKLEEVVKALINDPNIGMLFISFPITGPVPVRALFRGMEGSPKPKVMVALGDTSQLSIEVQEALKESPAVFGRSSDRAMRAIASYLRYGKLLARRRSPAPVAVGPGFPRLEKGPQPEWLGKKLLAAAGIGIPDGALARTEDEAVHVAACVGYPVVVKAQAAALTHKTEAGGVLLNIADASAIRKAWTSLHENVARAAPGVTLDGLLVEKMSAKGVKLMIGAKHDPDWGTLLLVGLGGIWVEAIGDVKLLPVDANETEIIDAIRKLRSAKLLSGFRGAPPVDIKAVSKAVMALGRLMRTVPRIVEVDVNPLIVHSDGQGAFALDALVVTK
jgi:acetate---CoA ligase (ADP-forming)